jgi:hypothetical protein
MTRAEWIELTTIVVTAAASFFARPLLPSAMPLWQIVLGLSVLLLAQSLVRDVAILFRKRHSQTSEPRQEAQCFCLESTVGMTGVIAGALFVGLGNAHQIPISHLEFSIAVMGILTLGFIIKDFVISWNPIGARREKDHLNLIVRWKRKSK